MRELKFRAWDNINNTMLFRDPQYGCPYAMGGVCGDKDKTYMQYTGLKDKNGNEIYEDDILYYKDVTWHTIDTAKGVVRFGKVDLGSNGFEYSYWINGFYVEQMWRREKDNEGRYDKDDRDGKDTFWDEPQPDEYFTEALVLEKVTVIGNIHENPELLKEVKYVQKSEVYTPYS